MHGGEYAPDGSPVPLYTAMQAFGEPELVHEAVPAGTTILELGAGAGRITRGLHALGHPVVAVDASPQMIAHIEGAETVSRTSDRLPSDVAFRSSSSRANFVNDPDRARLRVFLRCCAEHFLPGGQVLVQGYPRYSRPDSEWRDLGGVRSRLRSFVLEGRRLRGEMEYVVDGRSLFHAFEALLVSDAELDEDLRAARLVRRRTLDPRGAWIEAVPLRSV